LAEHLDEWCAATLCEPGWSLRAAHRRAIRTFAEPSRQVVDMLAIVDADGDPFVHAQPGDPGIPRALLVRRVREHVRALRQLPRAAVRARHAMAAELWRLAAVLPPEPEQAAREPDPPPSVLDDVPGAGEDATIQGVRFDPARQIYVPARVPAIVVHAL